MWQGMDRRRFPRADYPCKVLLIKNDRRKKFTTHTENIGVGGVCVILDDELNRFSVVELVLILDDRQLPICCNGRIVWTVNRKSLEDKAGKEVDTGIEFVDLKEQDRLRIERVVQECIQKQNP